jgi:DNA-binding LacI/PurR family transcriptional regulator
MTGAEYSVSPSQKNSELPVIALLTESLNSLYQSNCWIGASDEAVKRGNTLVCYAGGSLQASSWDPYEPQRNAIYNLINVRNLRGLIITGSMGNFITTNEFKTFYDRFSSLPIVCLGPGMPSVPSIIIDNSHGMRELVSHLVDFHACKKIAFVCGPAGNQDSEQRLNIFQEVLLEHGITPDPELIISGDFSRSSGAKAVHYLLDHYGRSFDALIGANDDMALGALKAFQERHIRVPDEVLVVGFDDIEESCFSAPPLTTVQQPLYKMGARAVETLIDIVNGKSVQQTNVVLPTLTIRQSCGCFRLGNSNIGTYSFASKQITEECRKQLYDEILSVMEQSRTNADGFVDEKMIRQFTDSFLDEIAGIETGQFVHIVNKVAWTLALSGGDTPGLLRAITVMRTIATSFNNGLIPEHGEELLQMANLAIADAGARAQAHRRLDADHQSTLLRVAGQEIASAFDFNHLLEVIASELTKLQIDECWISLYKPGEASISNLNMCLSLNSNGFLIHQEGGGFIAPNLAPDGVISMEKPRSLLVEPLFFRDEQIGVVIFDILWCRSGITYEILRQHISSALKGALLMKKVQEQSLALEVANVQLQKLRDVEHAHLEGIKRELELGREIQSSFLPREIPQIDGWEIHPAFQPAREVSGDFYDVFTLPGQKVVLVLSDVSGKDVGAALFMGMIRTLIRAHSEQAVSDESNPLEARGDGKNVCGYSKGWREAV